MAEKVPVADNARIVIQVGAEQHDGGMARRHTVTVAAHMLVGRSPETPQVEDEIVRLYRATIERVVLNPVDPQSWAVALLEALNEFTTWLVDNVQVEPGAFTKLPVARQEPYLPLLRGDFLVEPERKSAIEWSDDDGILIVDPDGWRVDGKLLKEEITRKEYEERLESSTVGPRPTAEEAV